MIGIDWPPTRTTFGFRSSISTLTSSRLAWGTSIPCSMTKVGPRDLGNEPLQAEVVGALPKGRCERLGILDLGTERRPPLGHDDFLHLAALADQFERQHADLEFLVDDGGSVWVRDEAFHRRDERGADRRMAGERDLAARREDPVAVVGRRVR